MNDLVAVMQAVTALAAAVGGGMMFVGAQREKVLADGAKARSESDLNLRAISERELALRVKLMDEHDTLVAEVEKLYVDVRELQRDNRLYKRLEEESKLALLAVTSELTAAKDEGKRQKERRDAEIATLRQDCAVEIAGLREQIGVLRERLEECLGVHPEARG